MNKSILYLTCLGICTLLVLPAYSQEEYFWQFNEGEGSTVTDIEGEIPLSLGLEITEDDIAQSSSESPSGEADDLSLDGGMGVMAIDEDGVLDITEGPITMEAWINTESLNTYNGIMAYGSSYKMGINNGNLIFTFYGIVDIDSEVPMETDSTWHHVAAAWEPDVGVNFYVDGELANTIETTDAPRAIENDILNIGSETNGGSPFPGLIDRARIHNALLDETQLDSDAANPTEPLENTIVSYDFNGGSVPYQNGTDIELPAVGTATYRQELVSPAFVTDSPSGEEGDYSLQFDGDDYGTYFDEQFLLDFYFEDFTFEAWLKYVPEEQVDARPIIASYGIGGQYGYSFSFNARNSANFLEDSPSEQAGDYSIEGALSGSDADEPFMDIQEGPITIEAWVKLNSITANSDILRYGNTYKAGFNADGNLLFTFLGVVDIHSEVPAPVDQQWHHIAYVWEPGVGVGFYVDGEEMGFVENTDTNRELQNNALAVGGTQTNTSRVDGQLDRVRVHNAILTAGELDSDASTPASPLENTVAYYNFDSGTAPAQNQVEQALPLELIVKGGAVTVTTYGIQDLFSDQAIIPGDNQWHHIAVVHEDQLEVRYYVDGELQETRPYTDGVLLVEDPTNFLIGRESSGNYFVGLMDRLRISRAAYTEDELDYFEPVPIADWSLY